jgi:uncharacterized protein YggU (UPF0235/DUF167 family)
MRKCTTYGSVNQNMYIYVRVIAGARAESVEQVLSDHLCIRVREEAERNQANTRILEILRGLYPNTVVRIINGHHSPSKLIAIDAKEE